MIWSTAPGSACGCWAGFRVHRWAPSRTSRRRRCAALADWPRDRSPHSPGSTTPGCTATPRTALATCRATRQAGRFSGRWCAGKKPRLPRCTGPDQAAQDAEEDGLRLPLGPACIRRPSHPPRKPDSASDSSARFSTAQPDRRPGSAQRDAPPPGVPSRRNTGGPPAPTATGCRASPEARRAAAGRGTSESRCHTAARIIVLWPVNKDHRVVACSACTERTGLTWRSTTARRPTTAAVARTSDIQHPDEGRRAETPSAAPLPGSTHPVSAP